MMRVAVLLVLALQAPLLGGEENRAAAFLLRDVADYDPRDLPEDADIREQAGRLLKQHGAVAEKHYLALKREGMQRRFARYAESLSVLGTVDNEASTKAICRLFGLADERTAWADATRDEEQREWQKCVVGYEPGQTNHTIKQKQTAPYHRHRTDELVLRDFAYALLGLRIDCVRFLRARESGDSIAYLERTALPRGKPEELRAKVAEILSARPETDPALFVRALGKERDAGVRAALLSGLARIEGAADHVAEVVRMLDDRSERVRIAAAWALMRFHRVEGVEPLIRRMGRETGLARERMARALESLTGKRLGAFPSSWEAWWEANGDEVLRGGLPPPGDEDPERALERKEAGGHFYGIPQVSHRIIYVIDRSGSMKHDVGGKTRLEACQSELTRAISALPREATFDVVLYNNEVSLWSETMVKAGPLADDPKSPRKQAQAFYGAVGPEGSTNIYDALRAAFWVAGQGTVKKGAELNADTIYLLTDGSPTTPDGKPDDTEKILEGVRRWNALGRMTIHTIGIGDNLNTGFLRQLAEENGGKFIQPEP